MSDIELVVKIPKEVKNRLCFGVTYAEDIQTVCEVLQNGTPLPKGHGRLIDISNIDVIELEDSIHCIKHVKGDEVNVYISAPIIIKADESEN